MDTFAGWSVMGKKFHRGTELSMMEFAEGDSVYRLKSFCGVDLFVWTLESDAPKTVRQEDRCHRCFPS